MRVVVGCQILFLSALQYLDDAEIRPGVKVKVSKAVFEMKGTTFQPKSKGSALCMLCTLCILCLRCVLNRA